MRAENKLSSGRETEEGAREDKLIERARQLEIQRAQNKTDPKDANANETISYSTGSI